MTSLPIMTSLAFDGPKPVCRRSRRVLVLLAAILVLSAADRVITLAFAKAGGKMEANPIAVYVAKVTHSPWGLAAFKAASVFTCIALLYRLRRYAVSELGAWLSLAILIAMSVMWHSYSTALDQPEELMLVQDNAASAHWMAFD
jgi:hypothetical protein